MPTELRMSSRFAVVALCIVGTLARVGDVQAHDYGAHRGIVAGENRDGWSLLLSYAPDRATTKKLMALYDKNGDGKLSRPESSAISDQLKKRATEGLRFSGNMDWSTAQSKVRYRRREGLSIAILVAGPKQILLSRTPNDPAETEVSIKWTNGEQRAELLPGETLVLARCVGAATASLATRELLRSSR